MRAGIRRYVRQHHIGLLALFIALGGTAWAAASINSGDVINNSLRSVDLKDGKAVKGADVVPESLDGTDIEEGSLGQVPSAVDAETLDGSVASDFVAPGSEDWHALALHPPGSSCGWVDNGGAAYFRDPAGIVHLKGSVRAVDGIPTPCDSSNVNHRRVTDINGIPAGYRPPHAVVFPVVSNNTLGVLTVFENLEGFYISSEFPTFANAKQWVALDGISWRCGPSGQNGCP